MTKELYREDPYLSEFPARVVRNSGREIILDRTAFFPGGSGQPSDKGEVQVGPVNAKVIEVRRAEPDIDDMDDFDDVDDMDELEDPDEDFDGEEEPEIVHVLDCVLPRTVREVRASLEWPRRYRNMRFNTALALLSGVTADRFGATSGVGRVRSGYARLDLTGASRTVDDAGVRAVEAAVNEMVSSGEEVVPDTKMGGLYVKEMSEVGGISVTRWFDRGSRGIRLEFTLEETGETGVRA